MINRENMEIFQAFHAGVRKSGIGANLHYIPIHLQPFYRRLGFKKNTFTESEKYFERASHCFSLSF